MGADYDDFEEKNIYKALNLIKPDAIVLQVRPDLVLDKFQYMSDLNGENIEESYLK